MIGYVTLGTNRFMDAERFIAWGTDPGKPMVAIIKPFDQEQATVGNGVMVALQVDAKEQVDAIYAKALELGGSDEGPPGPRGPGFYAGYFRDLDGNKLNAFVMG